MEIESETLPVESRGASVALLAQLEEAFTCPELRWWPEGGRGLRGETCLVCGGFCSEERQGDVEAGPVSVRTA